MQRRSGTLNARLAIRDRLHFKARKALKSHAPFITFDLVLAEFLQAFSGSALRSRVALEAEA
jgi:hypothetical protein